MSPGVDSFRAILEQSMNKLVICKPRTLNDGVEDSVKYRSRKKHCFLAAAILLFIGKFIITW